MKESDSSYEPGRADSFVSGLEQRLSGHKAKNFSCKKLHYTTIITTYIYRTDVACYVSKTIYGRKL